ncbi:MAG: hypothetical protein CMP39_00900 [Rickettsiales bacterium]|nr:hypothetical protein [Rickettsiales bacterium]
MTKKNLLLTFNLILISLFTMACSTMTEADSLENISTYDEDKKALQVIADKQLSSGVSGLSTRGISGFRQSSEKIMKKVQEKFYYNYDEYETWECNGDTIEVPTTITSNNKEFGLLFLEESSLSYFEKDYMTAYYYFYDVNETEYKISYKNMFYDLETCEKEYESNVLFETDTFSANEYSMAETIVDSNNEEYVVFGVDCDNINCDIMEKNKDFESEFRISYDDLEYLEIYKLDGVIYYETKENWYLNFNIDEVSVFEDCSFDSDFNYECDLETNSALDYIDINILHNNEVVTYYIDINSFVKVGNFETSEMTVYKDSELSKSVAKIVADQSLRLTVYMFDDQGVLETTPL